MQLTNGFVVSAAGRNFTNTHDVFSKKSQWIFVAVSYPELQQGGVHTHMPAVYPGILLDGFKKIYQQHRVIYTFGLHRSGN
jgi:hypothetical protein